MKSLIDKALKTLSYKVLNKQQPNIITITGSIGKTSTKEGVYFAVKCLGNVRRSLKNYNNELGVPFSVALWGKKAPSANPLRWLMVFRRLIAFSLSKNINYPKWLVLEIGSDKPGDLKYLMEMIPSGLLKCAVLTAVSFAHLEFFKTIEAIYQEKTVPFHYVAEDGFLVVNADNCDAERIKNDFRRKVITYSIQKPADIFADYFAIGDKGLSFRIKTQTGAFNFLLKQAISAYQAYPVLAGCAVSLGLGIKINDALAGLAEKEPLAGRMRLIAGIKNSLIIDDTYNSSPEAAKYALRALKDLPIQGRKIAVLGDMLELGPESPRFHKEIGDLAKQLGVDCLITFGKEAMAISKSSQHFTEHQKTSDYLKELIKENDVVLIKGSQGVRMEKIVKEIMAQPEKAEDLLVRQTAEWV